MALGTPATTTAQQGQTTMRPNGVLRLSFAGDGAYTTGGTLLFGATYLVAELGRLIAVTQCVGYGLTAGAITHMVSYDVATDALKVFVLATGAEAAGAANLSTVTFDIEVHYR